MNDVNGSENNSESEYESDSSYCDFSQESDSSDTDFENDHDDDNYAIFTGSRLKLNEFAILYEFLCSKLKLCDKYKDILLDFVKSVLPGNNKIPSSYSKLTNRLLSKFNMLEKKNSVYKVCNICYKKLNNNVNCDECMYQNANSKFRTSCDVAVFDIESQLIDTISKNWKNILEYRSIKKIQFIIYKYLNYIINRQS